MQPKIIMNLAKMKKGVENPRGLFLHLLDLTHDYITASDIMRTKYGIICRVVPPVIRTESKA